MGLDPRDLVAALPPMDNAVESPGAALHGLLADLARKPVPTGALHRLWALGSLQAKITAAYLAYWIRSGYRTADENERRLNETHLSAAIKLLGGMGYMRGMIMKIGQTLANYPNLVPADFARTLGQLHFDAPPMHFALLREQVRNELGRDPEDAFAEFEPVAFAAASLGQVHRARLRSGECVAVKVQYPNIARTIQSDFRNLMALMAPMRLSKDWDNIREQWDDIRQMLEWETDYEREADFLRRARAVFEESDGIVVPRVFDEYSTARVLTMEYLDGVHIEEYLTGEPPQSERDRYGELLMRSSFRIAHSAKLWYADSHPGNYLFLKDGRFGVIDFGCCREFSDEEWGFYKEVAEAIPEGGDVYRRAMIRAADLDPDGPVDEAHVEFLVQSGLWYHEYMDYDGQFDFSNEASLQRGIDMIATVAKKRYFRFLPVNMWISRQLLGLRAMAYRLRARVNVKTIAREESHGIYA